MIDDELIGKRIKVARKLIGYTQGDIAVEMDMSISTISDIERGQRSVTGPELHSLAELLNQPLDFFLTPQETSSPAFRYLFREANKQDVNKAVLHQFERLCLDYRLLEEITGAPVPPKPPDYSSFGFENLTDADKLAKMERARLGLGDAPISDITELLDEQGGARIFHLPVTDDNLSGAAAYDRQNWACILVNANEEPYRRTFTIAHEYAHCLAHLKRSPKHKDTLAAHIDTRHPEDHFPARSQKERFANAFAASFLMPAERVNELYERFVRVPRRFTDDMLYLMAKYFGVSHIAVGWRLVTLRKISERDWKEYLSKGYSRPFLARQLGLEEEQKEAGQIVLPPRYQYLAWEAFEQEEISLTRLAELLQKDAFELREDLRRREGQEVYEFATRRSTA
jgi:Zn-dependent peptidase ImmA (M78 family)/DNA-binding XRE family transcriptional regulator